MNSSRIPIGQMLLRAGRIDAWQLQSGLAHQRRWGGRLGDALVGLGFVTEPVLLEEVARQHGVPYVDLSERFVAPEVIALLPAKIIRGRKVLPLALGQATRRGPLLLATAAPQNLELLDEVAFASGYAVKPVLASDRDLDRAIARHLDGVDALRVDGLGGAGGGSVPLPDDTSTTMQIVPLGYDLN